MEIEELMMLLINTADSGHYKNHFKRVDIVYYKRDFYMIFNSQPNSYLYRVPNMDFYNKSNLFIDNKGFLILTTFSDSGSALFSRSTDIDEDSLLYKEIMSIVNDVDNQILIYSSSKWERKN